MEDRLLTFLYYSVALCGFATLFLVAQFVYHNPEMVGAQDAWNQSQAITEQMGFDYSEDL